MDLGIFGIFPELPSLKVRGGLKDFRDLAGIFILRGSAGFRDFRDVPEIVLLRGSGGHFGIFGRFRNCPL